MALDFPANPTNGQVYGSYAYNSTVGAWQSKEDPATVATISAVFPNSANPGDIWYDSDDGTSYIYYDDGTSAQWVELLSSGLPLLDTKANLSGGNVFSGSQSINSSATSQTPLTVNGITSQSANLQEWKDSSGTVLASVMASGNIRSNAFGSVAAGNSYMLTASDANSLLVNTNAATNKGFVVRGVASQTANLQEWQNSSATVLLSITSSGVINSTARIIGTTPNDNGSTGGVAIKAPSGGSQTSAYLQFVNNAYTAQLGAIEATTGGIIRISANQVLMPAQPSFRARVNISTAYAAGWQKISATTEVHDNAGNYDAANSRFTAPVAGVYFVSGSVSSNGADGDGTAAIAINGSPNQYITQSSPGASGVSYTGVGVSAAIKLAANDYVELWRYFGTGQTTRTADWSGYFSAHLLG